MVDATGGKSVADDIRDNPERFLRIAGGIHIQRLDCVDGPTKEAVEAATKYIATVRGEVEQGRVVEEGDLGVIVSKVMELLEPHFVAVAAA